jgi:hypothetical protein
VGAVMRVRAMLTEYGIPVERRAAMRAELQRPDGSSAALSMTEVGPGIFETAETASMQGVYRFRLVASGITMRGAPFTREQLVSGAVVPGGDQPFPKTAIGDNEALCQLLHCLLRPEGLGRWLAGYNVDLAVLQKCIERWCKSDPAVLSVEELRRREGV